METIKKTAHRAGLYLAALGKWSFLAALIGGLCGVIGTAFHVSVDVVTEFRLTHPWVLWALPVLGLAIVGLYKLLRVEGKGTNHVLLSVQNGEPLPLALTPAIFLSTVLTHLGGGSVGREGAALQMGGSLGYTAGKWLRLSEEERRVAVLMGMAAFFTALFGTPLAATIFAIGVVSLGVFCHAALLPSLLPAVTPMDAIMLLRVAGLAALCAVVSMLFCFGVHQAEHLLGKGVKNPWLRVALGGGALIALTLLMGNMDYNGAGMGVIAAAIEQGRAAPWAFALKIIFTALSLGAGFKGGEVVPSFFVGATFGCVAGPLLGIPAGFAAAVGLAAVFCGATNSPVASLLLAVEMFGGDGLIYYALACALSNLLSGYAGLYSAQRVRYDKLRMRRIDAHTNRYAEK